MSSQNKSESSRGPRGKRGEIRNEILVAARAAFVKDGYDGTTMRRIARNTGCDSAMISYYFGSKQQLFRECFNLPADPAEQILKLILEDPTTAGERAVRYALTMYEESLTGETLRALMRALMTDVATSERFRDYFRTDVLGKVMQTLGSNRAAAEQVELNVAQMYGIVTMRYVVRLEPLASMPREDLVTHLSPRIQELVDALIETGPDWLQ